MWWSQLVSFVTNPWVGFAFAAIVLVVGWKMTAPRANALLVFAWAILVVSVFRTPFIGSLEPIPRALTVALTASVMGLLLYYTLWTRTGRVTLKISATTSEAEHPAGEVLGGIEWSLRYAELRVTIVNPSEIDYSALDLVLMPDVAVAAAGQLSDLGMRP